MENREVCGAGVGLQPLKTHMDTEILLGWAKEAPGWEVFPAQPNPFRQSPNPFGHSPNPSGCRPGGSQSRQDPVPTEGLGRVCPHQLHPCQAGTARPEGAGGVWDTMSPWRPHGDTATGTETPGKGLARGRGGPLAPHSPGGAAIRKKLETLARPAEGSSAWPGGREGGRGAKHAGIFVLSSPGGEAEPEGRGIKESL